MARKPKEETVEEIQVQEPPKQTFVVKWFNEHATANAQELKIVCDLTSRSCEKQFSMFVPSSNTQVYAVIFYVTFISIIEYIKSKQSKYNNFTMEIGQSINIGYSNSTDTENEKVGNFFPILEHIGRNINIIDSGSDTDEDRTSKNAILWKSKNVKKNSEVIKDIEEMAYDKLKKVYKTNTRISGVIIPIFCIFMDHIMNTLKMKFEEAEGTNVSEVSMNVFGLFDIFYSFNDKDIYEFIPGIMVKLDLKSDTIAGRE